MDSKTDKQVMTRGRGQPTKYCEEIVTEILRLAMKGKTELYIAKKLKISYDTITEWKNVHSDFSVALKKAKDASDDEIVATLRERALGYKKIVPKFFYDKDSKEVICKEVEEYFPPDTTSIIFWLKNRQPKEWRDINRQEITGKDGEALTMPQVVLTLPDNGRTAKDEEKK